MSGICGVVALDGGPASLGPMLKLLERRGPEGSRSWACGPVVLGHTLLATTPEALVEVLPLTDPAGGCTITADARLDNREDLIAALGLSGATRVVGDGELILHSYLKWGEECPTHLLGDFAFAIWDPPNQRLFCARDHMGMKQFNYWHVRGKAFVFATEAEAVVTHPDVPKADNLGRIADYLDNLEGLDLISTFFENVFRLPPAHRMIIHAAGLSLSRFWKLELGQELKLGGDHAYAAAFRTIFTEAVRCRLRSAGRVGSMLSGGMDSNAVAAMAAEILNSQGRGRLLTLSGINSDPAKCVESQAIALARANPLFHSLAVSFTDIAPLLDDLIYQTENIVEPFDRHMTMHRALFLTARRAGVTVLLDGAAGDVALNSGDPIKTHLRRFAWRLAWREAKGEQDFWKIPHHAVRAIVASAWRSFVPRPIQLIKRRLAWRRRAIFGEGWVADDLAKIVHLRNRRRRFQKHSSEKIRTGSELRAQVIRHPHLTVGRERYDRVAAQAGVEPRDPFIDIRVIQFCLSLPESQLQRGGWPKWILRRAMAGKVPDAVIWRRGKEHLGWHFTTALLNILLASRAKYRASTELAGQFISSADRSNDASDALPGNWGYSRPALFLGFFLARHSANRNR